MHRFHDSFLFEEKAKAISVLAKDDLLSVVLDDTIFYPGGGGQPCDTGIMRSSSFEGEVISVDKQDDLIVHKVKPFRGELHSGEEVMLLVNMERRTRLIRMHTGEHILFKSLEHSISGISLAKIDLGTEESTLFISADEITWEKLFKAEELANKIIDEDRPMIEKEYQKSDAVMMEKLRIKPERIKSDTVRVLEVKDFDWSACHGTHAKSTSYVGNILVTKFNFAKGCWEIRFKTNVKKDLFDMARIARESASLFEIDVNNVPVFIRKFKEEAEGYRDRFRKLSFKMLDNFKTEKIGPLSFIYNVVEDIEKKQLVDKAAELVKEDTAVCFVNVAEGKATVLLSIFPALKLNAPEILNRALARFSGKGGGRDSFAMGSVEERYARDIIEETKKELSDYN